MKDALPISLLAGKRLGPYEIQGRIGAGGMGEVYRARDTRLERSVAIKILAPELASEPSIRSRFEREARAVAALNHPNICALYDIGPNRRTHDSGDGAVHVSGTGAGQAG